MLERQSILVQRTGEAEADLLYLEGLRALRRPHIVRKFPATPGMYATWLTDHAVVIQVAVLAGVVHRADAAPGAAASAGLLPLCAVLILLQQTTTSVCRRSVCRRASSRQTS